MIEIQLKEGQHGYEAVDEYVRRYWEHNVYDDVVISLSTSYDGETYYPFHTIAEPQAVTEQVLYDFDWWEGEKFIKLFGIINVNKLNISGGIYVED